MSKQYASLIERVESAFHAGTGLNISGAGSKSFYGRTPRGEILDVREHRNIIDYDPAELVIVAQAGTPLADIESALAEKQQMLGFEPPFASQGATLGGAIASGLSGARRPYYGAVRDYLLGTKTIDGKGQINQFGGRVMKNVAGFDLFRPMAGAMGTLGVLLEASLRVIPIPELEQELAFTVDQQAEAISLFTRYSGQLPSFSAASWHQGTARVRLSGSGLAVERDRGLLAKNFPLTDADTDFRTGISQLSNDFFKPQETEQIVVLDLAPASAPLQLEGEWLLDWGGARRYLKSDLPVESIRQTASKIGAYATLLQGGERDDCFHPLPETLMKVHTRLKQAFDPRGILNPGRLYAGL